jgi:hypothetical protein
VRRALRLSLCPASRPSAGPLEIIFSWD